MIRGGVVCHTTDNGSRNGSGGPPLQLVLSRERPSGLQAGVDAEALSHEEYIQVKGEIVTSTFTKPGVYNYYCAPHQGAGMVGKITVQ